MHSFLALLAIGVLVSLILQAVPTPTEPFPHSFPLGDEGRYILFWKFDDETITFEAHVKTTGYVGLGISKTGGMKNADIAIGWVNNGDAYIQDYYADGEETPRLDKSQDLTLLDGSENETHTIIKFRRKLSNCDLNDVDITNDTVKLIWAYHSNEPGSLDSDPPYHGSANRGSRSIQLLTSKNPNPQLPNDVKQIDFVADKVSVPAVDTTYWCTGFSLPSETMAKKHHVVKIEPVIEEKNTPYVHHMLIYGCFHELTKSGYEDWNDLHGQGAVCYSSVMPSDECKPILFGWAVGEEGFYYPDHVGFPIGGPEETALFLILEIHYDNPDLRSDIVDSSGLRIYVTEDLRKYDAGLIELGLPVLDTHIIPPKSLDFKSMSYCPDICMKEGLSSVEEIKMFAGILHAHLAGSAIRLRHFRDGKELPPIYRDENYDFNFQEFRLLQEEIPVKPTDELVVECQYKTVDRNSVTKGGLATSDEMCLVFMQYYPRLDISKCQSVPTIEQTLSFITDGVKIRYEKYAGKDIYTMIEEAVLDNPRMMQNFQDAVFSGDHIYTCSSTKANVGGQVTIPDYIKPMVQEETKCTKNQCELSVCDASTLTSPSVLMLILTVTAVILKSILD